MAKKAAIRVALDLETTGLHAEQDAILEVAAVKFQGTEVIDTFESFVSPGRSIPYRVQRLTGIKPEQLIGAPLFDAIAKKLQVFLGDYPIVGHSIPFDVGFLRRWDLARTNPLIDTFELATVLLPSLTSYNLGQVAEALGIPVPHDRHRAMVDTVLAMNVFLALHQRLQAVDLTLLRDLAHLDAPRSWPLLHFFRQELRDRQEHDGLQGSLARGSLGDRFAAQLGMDPRVLSFAIGHKLEPTEKVETVQALPEAPEVLNTLEHVQTIVEVDTKHEEPAVPRGYQAARSAIRGVLEQPAPLLLEVATGGGDYTLVLQPALEWLTESSPAEKNPRRLIIACATQQHARRLVEAVLPRLLTTLNSQLPIAYLAERGGYLCTERWFGAALRRTSGELTAEQARGLAKLGLWAQQTLTGERSELTLLPQEMAAWERISSGVERLPSADKRAGTAYERCTYRRKGYCFVSLAEERVKAASIVVTTHSGLFDQLSQPHSLLKSIPRRLILDADLLEEENARGGSADLDQTRLLRLLDTLGVELPTGRYQGLLALAAPSLRENGPGGLSSTPTIAKSELDSRMLNWFQSLRQARQAVEKLFSYFFQLLEEHAQGSGGSGHEKGSREGQSRSHNARNLDRMDQPLRLTPQIRHLGAWGNVEKAWQQLAQRLQAVIDHAREAEKMLLAAQRGRNRLSGGSGEDSSVALELVAVVQRLLEQKQLGQQAMALESQQVVYWLRIPPTPAFSTHSHSSHRSAGHVALPENAPILYSQQVQTALLVKGLLTENTCNIFAGTALSVDHSFSFIRGRFGLDADTCSALSLVTEHHEQTLLYIPNDVPEPNVPQYQRHLDEALIHLSTALEGQLVALFTSHAALRSSYATIKPLLETRGILVLGQGIDGSPRQLWQVFQRQEKVVLLGAGGFWDGVEEVSRAPACIFIARLPMPVLNDPPIAARAEQYSDQLHQLTVPMAALRMRRALNRLAWSDTKRNVVVIFDRRVISKEYGSMIMHSLPRCSQRHIAVSLLPETVLDWLTGSGAWD